jgi:CubicO group peptidase (beta-lactamase class C family)
MIKYLDFLTGDPKRQAEYEKVLKRSTLEEMWQPQLPTDVDANGNSGFTTDIGLIFFVNKRGGRTLIGHGGDQNGFLSYIDVDPSAGRASVIVMNTDPTGSAAGKEAVSRLRRSVAGLF